MTPQPSLFDGLGTATRQRRSVPRSSVEAYQRTAKQTRMSDVVRWLARFDEPKTSAELAQRGGIGDWTDLLLYVRRGLSDAKARGLVEHAGKRICGVAKTLAVTWRVRSR